MSGGGPWKTNKFWLKNPTTRYIPLVAQSNLEPFLTPSNLPDTKSSRDPLLIAKPISSDSEEIPPETKRNVHITICQNGGSLELDRQAFLLTCFL